MLPRALNRKWHRPYLQLIERNRNTPHLTPKASPMPPTQLKAFLLTGALVVTFGACGAAESTSDSPAPSATCPRLVEDFSDTVADPPDGAAECASGDCNYQTQEGCPQGQACRPQFNATEPVVNPGCEAAGEVAVGEACETSADCVAAAFCAHDRDGVGTCRKLCCGADWSACDEGESCIRSLDVRAGGEVISAGVDLCFPVGTCGIFDPKGCANDPGRECKIVDPTGAVACAPISTAQLNDPCGPPDVCAQGLNCVGGYCVKLCAWEACGVPACTASEGTCVHFERDPAGVGECTLGR